jgi:hypothetical protein
VELVQKFAGGLWTTMLDRSPYDVVAWHGNYAPYVYDLSRFMTLGTISFDHPDPSIFTVLTSTSHLPGIANADFVIFPPRWLVGEDTFRPPWYHRNVMSEFMGLVHGVYDAKADGFEPGGASLHNAWTSHGPDATTHRRASDQQLAPGTDRRHAGLHVRVAQPDPPDGGSKVGPAPAGRLRPGVGRVGRRVPAAAHLRPHHGDRLRPAWNAERPLVLGCGQEGSFGAVSSRLRRRHRPSLGDCAG